MVQVIENTGGFGTRFGAALGKGLGEAIPKVTERHALSQGLKNLGNVSMDKPLDAISQMMSIPGMTLEKAQVLFPFLQQQMQRQEAARRGGGQGGAQSGQSQAALQPGQAQIGGQAQGGAQGNAIPTIQGLEQQPGAGEALPQQGLLSPEDTQILQQTFQPLSYNEKLNMANQLMQQYPSSFPTLDSSMAEVDKGEANRQSQFTSKQGAAQNKSTMQDKAESEFNKQLSKKTQANLEANPVWGDLQGDLMANMFKDIRNGATVKDAAAKYGKIANEIAETISTLNARGGESLWKASPANNRETFTELGKTFSKLSKQKEYAQLLSSTQNIPIAYAHPFAYPLDNNKELASYVRGIKNIGTDLKFQLGNKGYEEVAKNIMDKLGKNDSPLTVLLALQNKGLDGKRMMDILKSNYEDQFTVAQWKDLTQSQNLQPNLSANWLNSFSGMP